MFKLQSLLMGAILATFGVVPKSTSAISVADNPPSRAPYAGVATPGGTVHDDIDGIVTRVDKNSITVAGFEKKIEKFVPITGGKYRVEIQIVPAQAARRFSAVGPLATGGFLEHGIPSAQYRLSDVRVGDQVYFDWRTFEGVDEVHYIMIKRRPGGKVPPSPGEKAGEKHPHHERMNAQQAFEERGEAIPYEYHPGGSQKQVAPPPRAVKPK